MMKCESLQFYLPLFSDGEMSAGELAELSEHLATCPVCRARHAEFVSLRNDLRGLSRPGVPADMIQSVKNAVAREYKRPIQNKNALFSRSSLVWLQYNVMPYSVGTVVSVILTISLLYTLLSTREATKRLGEELAANRATMVIGVKPNRVPEYGPDSEIAWTKESYAAVRVPVSMESPSLNPQGALVALTKSFARGNMRDDEVTVVADVLSNGYAQVAKVVEAPRDRQSMSDFTNAFDNQNNAPFVPSNLDNRSEDMRVVFKVIWVDATDEKTIMTSKYPKNK